MLEGVIDRCAVLPAPTLGVKLKTEFNIKKEHEGITFSGSISSFDIDKVYSKLNSLDRALLLDQNYLPEDYLLVLEMLFRRIWESKRVTCPDKHNHLASHHQQ